MTWRKGHGNGAGKPRIEVLPPDELPSAVPAPAPYATELVIRRDNGKVLDSASAKALGARGGLAKARKRHALRGLGLHKLSEIDEFHPYWKVSEEWIQEKLIDLASHAGGFIGPGPTMMVAQAGRQHVASIYLYDQAMKIGGPASAKLFLESANLADKARIGLMTAFEMGVREAKARLETASVNPYAALDAIEDDTESD